jgi:hypothetical protein
MESDFIIPAAAVEPVARGGAVQLRQGDAALAVVDARRLRRFLAEHLPANVQWGREKDTETAVVPVLNLAAEGTPHEVKEQLLSGLREYAEDWLDRLHAAPNHAGNWPWVQLIQLSTDSQLWRWLNAPCGSTSEDVETP